MLDNHFNDGPIYLWNNNIAWYDNSLHQYFIEIDRPDICGVEKETRSFETKKKVYIMQGIRIYCPLCDVFFKLYFLCYVP